ncbi:unnamed protein product [Linum trigynum]|uniref:Uncharacterized protein n=1 Tax=Linum trigynum TaxID=586398 RepID=A0AAV2DYI4_9ROSI
MQFSLQHHCHAKFHCGYLFTFSIVKQLTSIQHQSPQLSSFLEGHASSHFFKSLFAGIFQLSVWLPRHINEAPTLTFLAIFVIRRRSSSSSLTFVLLQFMIYKMGVNRCEITP